jgi:hypothetical protein
MIPTPSENKNKIVPPMALVNEALVLQVLQGAAIKRLNPERGYPFFIKT